MGIETFDPAEKKYRKTDDLPAPVRDRFQDVGDGFVRKEVLQHENYLTRRAEEETRNGKPMTALELAAQSAMQTDAAITAESNKQIEKLETALGTTLSDEAKREIYQGTAPSAYLSANEFNRRLSEQGLYRNEQISALCARVVTMPDEKFNSLSREERRRMLEDIASFDQFVHGSQEAHSLHDASKRLLETYEPGLELQALHGNVRAALLDTFDAQRLIETNGDWTGYDDTRKVAVWQEVVDTLSAQYGLGYFPVIPVERASDTNEALASFSEDGKLLVTMSKMREKPFFQTINAISHEMAHAYQKKLTTSETTLPDTLREDAAWFALDEKLEHVYGRDFYHKHYRLMSKEQDAHQAGDAMEFAAKEMYAATRKEWAERIKEYGFPPLIEISNNYEVSLLARTILDSGIILTGDELMKALENEHAISEDDSAPLFKGRTLQGCQEKINESVNLMGEARKILSNMTRKS